MGDAEKVAPSRDTSALAGAESTNAPIDVTGIFKSVGDVPYEWLIDSDVLRWGDNVGSVVGINDLTTISTGRAYARLLDASSPKSRFDAVTQSAACPDPALGAPFQAKYCLQPNGPAGGKVWIEDVGRWF